MRAASLHGEFRQLVGFSPAELAVEFHRVRSALLRLWQRHGGASDPTALEQMIRFDEAFDDAMTQSMESYSTAAARSRDTFLAVLGHDLRNPLGSIAGCLELLEVEALTQQRRQRSLAIARRSVASIQQMITDLLEYTRTRLGQGIKVDPCPGDLGRLCREAADDIQTAHPARAFNVTVPDALHASFDAARMHQVLGNLLANAVQHGDPGRAMSLVASQDGATVTIEVWNAGTPIPPELMQVIFDPLVQIPTAASEPHRRPASSLGLGLFIAREIVTAHGGRLQVTSSNDGTTFIVTLPKTQPSRTPERAPKARWAARSTPGARRGRSRRSQPLAAGKSLRRRWSRSMNR